MNEKLSMDLWTFFGRVLLSIPFILWFSWCEHPFPFNRREQPLANRDDDSVVFVAGCNPMHSEMVVRTVLTGGRYSLQSVLEPSPRPEKSHEIMDKAVLCV